MRNLSSDDRRNLVHLNSLRGGFTLVELMVVITIMLLLFGMTVYGINFTRDADKVRGAASQVQSFLSGARDRAIYAKEPRGVRFFVNPANPRSVSAMAYIQPGQNWSYGNVDLERLDINPRNNVPDVDSNGFSHVVVVRGERLGWWQLKRRGLLTDGSRIRMPRDTGNWYEVDTSLINITAPPTGQDFLLLRIPFSDAGGDSNAVVAHSGMTYELELPSQLLPQEPSLLPEGAVIDLDGSKIPNAWRPSRADAEGQFSPYMDIFFSPRGNVIGTAAGTGLIHFYICDAEDSLNLKSQYLASIPLDDPGISNGVEPNLNSSLDSLEMHLTNRLFVPADEIPFAWIEGASTAEPFLVKDRKVVTVFAQTGAITVSAVDSSDFFDPLDFNGNGNFSEPDGFADSPFAFAQSGKGGK
jgi:prepilin-type N-terminal cleavage/methylation domain-containing protein